MGMGTSLSPVFSSKRLASAPHHVPLHARPHPLPCVPPAPISTALKGTGRYRKTGPRATSNSNIIRKNRSPNRGVVILPTPKKYHNSLREIPQKKYMCIHLLLVWMFDPPLKMGPQFNDPCKHSPHETWAKDLYQFTALVAETTQPRPR